MVRSLVVHLETPSEAIGPDHRIDIAAEPIRARAWWGDVLLADTAAALRSDEPDLLPLLWFPAADVRADLLVDEGHRATCPVKGDAQLWSLAGTPSSALGLERNALEAPVELRDDGVDVAWSLDRPYPAAVELVGRIGFDHDRVRLELVEDWADGEPFVTRFPNWGDADHLVDIVDVQPDSDTTWTASIRGDAWRPVVEGSQMLGQTLVAAMRHSGGRRVVSAHMVFVRAGDARVPLVIHLDEVSNGRTFTAVDARVVQGGRTCASGTVLLDATAPDLIRHERPAPEGLSPQDCTPFDMSVSGRALRVADGAYPGEPDDPPGPPEIDAWVRFREVPDDPALHAGLLAQFAGHMSIAAAMRPHGGVSQSQAHRTLSTGISGIAISFHADVRADRWMRYHHVSTYAGAGMTRSECHVYDIDGHLLASFSVDAMVRAMPSHIGTGDPRASM